MCHAFVSDSRFYQFLFHIDQEMANEVQREGCAHCGGRLHVACYPRKPRGICCALDESYETRLSFCCATEGCRRRCTPPSVRFLGRKVYLGAMVVLVMAMEHGLSAKRRKQLIEKLDLYPQTLARWRRWPLLASQQGPLYPACGCQPVTRCAVGAIDWRRPRASCVSVAAFAGPGDDGLLVRLFEGGNQSAEDVIALPGKVCLDSCHDNEGETRHADERRS